MCFNLRLELVSFDTNREHYANVVMGDQRKLEAGIISLTMGLELFANN